MISLFLLGAVIGSGACIILDQAAQIKILKEENRNYFIKYERDNNNENILSESSTSQQ